VLLFGCQGAGLLVAFTFVGLSRRPAV